MKKLFVSLLTAATLIGAPGAFMTTAAVAQTQCGPDVPSGWLEPGGFCDQSGSTGSLTLPLDTPQGAPCEPHPYLELLSALEVMPVGERIHVAAYCDPPVVVLAE